MSFFTDILSGGGNLYRDVTPSWFRNLAPREIQPGGFNPGRDYLGVDLDGSLAAEQVQRARAAAQAQQQQANASFQQSANAPIPGVTGPTSAGLTVAGLLGGAGLHQIQDQNQPQRPEQPPFVPYGPYGQQAAQMAGLLGGYRPLDPKRPQYPIVRPVK